jgi:hypothetical protein
MSRLLAPLGAVIFTLAWIVLGAISPGYRLFDLVIDPYSPIAQPISGLGLGVTGPWMNTAFIVSGALVATGAILAARTATTRLLRVATILLSLTGVGMILDGIFTLESVMLHLVGFLLAVPLPAVGLIIAGIGMRKERPASIIAIAGGILTLVLFAAFMATFDPYSAGDNSGISGLLQRTLVTVHLAATSATLVALSKRRAS